MIDWYKKQTKTLKIYLIYYLIATVGFSILFAGRIVVTSIFIFQGITLLVGILSYLKRLKTLMMPFIYSFSFGSLVFATFFCYMDGSGSSMESTISSESKTFILQQNFYLKRHMIIQFEMNYLWPDESEERNYKLVKRIVGMPKDSVYFLTNDEILINDEIYKLHYTGVKLMNDTLINGKIPNDYYFVLGDNRESSLDSRYFGLVHKSQVGGIVLFSF